MDTSNKRSKWVWLSRDASLGACYNVHLTKRPAPTKHSNFSGHEIYDDCDMVICAKEFKKAIDFSLKPGEKAKVKITIEQIGHRK